MTEPIFSYEIVEPPAGEVVTLAQAKSHLRQTSDHEDSYIESLIPVARSMCEAQCGRHFLTTTVRLTYDSFPGSYFNYRPEPIRLLRAPVREVVSLEYFPGGSDEPEAVDPVRYVLLGGNLPCVGLKRGEWPMTDPDRVDAVRITYRVGFGDDADSVDARHRDMFRLAQTATLWVLAGLFEQRSFAGTARAYEFDVPTLNLLAHLYTGAVN